MGRLQEASVDPYYVFPKEGNSMPVYDASTGELLKDIPLVEMIRVSRNKMRKLCAEGIDVNYAHPFHTLRTLSSTPTISAYFPTTSATGTLIVAADGANSDVRKAIYPPSQGASHQIPYGGVNMPVQYPSDPKISLLRKSLSPIQCIAVHPKGYWLWLSVQDVPYPSSPETWTFQLQWTWKAGTETASLAELDLEKLKAEAETSFAEPFKTAWLRFPPGTKIPSANRISVWEPLSIPEDMFKGKVALIGDAAHAMSFHRGQGMNHGIADAVKSVEVLERVDKGEMELREALKEYENEMINRAGEEVTVSKMNTEMMHDWERLMGSPFMRRGGDRNQRVGNKMWFVWLRWVAVMS